ncbi:MAG TPA: hypothetical protein DCE41_25350 [Cytophagales bacterium]|nr:hypothetical protein [Cytophagales bacterium]HAA21995.1 hypothetical protein [Cytophagales bacterium]HAP61894.1 hypothetical protein [Cytophagales bacterium]
MNQMTADEMNRRSDAIDKEIKSEIEQLEENGLIPEGYEVSYSIGVEDNYLVLQNCNFYIKGTRNRGYKGLRFPPGEM